MLIYKKMTSFPRPGLRDLAAGKRKKKAAWSRQPSYQLFLYLFILSITEYIFVNQDTSAVFADNNFLA